ncbi:amidohydrolase [Streptomyces sulfonofaciens]|uniref:Amidohydrolase n=1 Tax=Streptomyces sulfonofaciens TaxID=68272 RepID=A0A919GQY0_9ACTN|nr:M20 family metallopeptidase [Streptomyces sulfonofaciens]GHH88230.1 amidohydrolase [Streptomyces sulfonofaciens]
MSEPLVLRARAREFADDLIRLRRALHAEPETGLDLPRTQQKVLAALDGPGLGISTGKALSSVTAVLRGSRPGGTVLLRADMDALPLTERNDLPYASRNPEAMHACGHDLHTAMLVGAARLLGGAEFAGTVVFMFQPGEEGYGGARLMVEEGVLEAGGRRADAAFALHVTPSLLPRGMVVSRPGPVLAACDALRVTVRGAGGHSASPHLGKDPIPAACEMVGALGTWVTRSFDAFDPVVATVTSFHAGAAENAVPEEARFTVTVRSFSRQHRDRLLTELRRVVTGIGSAHGLAVETEHSLDYPVTVNDPAQSAFAADVVREVFGPERYFEVPRPVTASEDFSYVLDEVPGAYLFVGACPDDRDPGTAAGNHSPDAVFDDAVLADGAALYAELALRRLRAWD